MFDWSEDELTNLIWGDDDEAEDHIVPCQEKDELSLNKNEWNEDSQTHKPTEQKPVGVKIDLHVKKVDALAEPVQYGSTSSEKTPELGKCRDIFQCGDDFSDYSWADIVHFDDLDQLFRNDVSTFNNNNIGGDNECWSSRNVISNSPSQSFSSILETPNVETDQRCSSSGKPCDPLFQNVPNVSSSSNLEHYHGYNHGQSASNEKKMNLLKFSKTPEGSEARTCQNLYYNWSRSRNLPGKYESQLVPSSLQSSLTAMNPQRKTQGSKTSQCLHISNQCMASSGFENFTNPYSSIPIFSSIQSPDLNTRFLHPYHGVSHAHTTVFVNHTNMTPQEKVEKLRHRQQMQAMLAIQKQQQQFLLNVPQSFPQEHSLQLLCKTDIHDIAVQPSFDPNSAFEKEASANCAAAIGDDSAEFPVLYQLQDVIDKLDMQARLCIRDSIFRLAGNAVKRHHAGSTTQSNRTSHTEYEAWKSNRYAGMVAETVTNRVDRTVAHLLFHRHIDMSRKHPEGQESPASSMMETQRRENVVRSRRSDSHITKLNVAEDEHGDTLRH